MRLPVAPVLPDEVARKADLAEGVNYSLEPVNTGVRWIDAQPVFRRVFILMTGAAPNVTNVMLHVPGGWGFFGLVSLDGYITTSIGDRVPVGYFFAPDDYFGVRISSNTDIVERHGGTAMNSRPVVLILDYISQPIGTSSWDQGTAAWDAGTTTWDQLTPQIAPLWDGGVTNWDDYRR